MSSLHRTLLGSREDPMSTEFERDIEGHEPKEVEYAKLVRLSTTDLPAKTSRIRLLETRRRRANRRV